MATPISHEKKLRNGIAEEIFAIENWVITARRSHILNSKCTNPVVCDKTRHKFAPNSPQPETNTTASEDQDNNNKDEENKVIGGATHGTPRKTLKEVQQLKATIYDEPALCQFCKYDLILEMAHLPDMTYAQNLLEIRHRPSGLLLNFNVLDSLVPVIVNCTGLPAGMKVSPSEAWLKARMDCEYTKNVMNADFDWTFTTDYKGSFSLTSDLKSESSSLSATDSVDLAAALSQPTSDRIDIEKLKVRNTIHFYDEIDLFEDELADHGIAKSNVKIRVMADSFFILLRFFLRVDNVFVRFYDTRMYHEFGSSYLLRECSIREGTIAELALKEDEALHLMSSPAELYNHVPEKSLRLDKIMLPEGKIQKQSIT